jgi:hypothetical protein
MAWHRYHNVTGPFNQRRPARRQRDYHLANPTLIQIKITIAPKYLSIIGISNNSIPIFTSR